MARSKQPSGGGETPKRIIETARHLFAMRGFGSTSVRDIARKAEVNLSAVNYHFQSKEGLYWTVMLDMHEETNTRIGQISEESADLKEFAVKVHKYCQDDPDFVRINFKLLMTEVPLTLEAQEAIQGLGADIGPPGADFYKDFIRKELSFEASEDGLNWAMEVLFRHTVHTCMLQSSPLCSIKSAQLGVDSKVAITGLEWLIDSTLSYMKAHVERFQKLP